MSGCELSVSERVAAPPGRVFATASNFGGAAGTIEAILRTEVLTPGPVGVGTRFRETRKLFGKEATEEMTVTEFDAPRRYVLGAESHGCVYRSEMRFEPDGDGTKVTMTFRSEPRTFVSKVMSVLMKPMMKMMFRMCAKDLADLKRAVEGGREPAV